MLAFIRGTTTTTGLKVEAELDQEVYLTGRKVTEQQFSTLALLKHDVCLDWNYTLSLRLLPMRPSGTTQGKPGLENDEESEKRTGSSIPTLPNSTGM